jgi:endonuclease YncB( thermonuclease family)
MDETPGMTYSAEVISVTDGDTLVMEFNGTEQRSCRIFGIDTPETVYASTVWASVYDQLPTNLKIQKWGVEATSRFNELLIGNSGQSTPIGLVLSVTIRDVDVYNRLVVTVQNDKGQDVGAELVLSGHAAVWDQYADDIPALYAIYKSNENQAQDQKLIIWSDTIPYMPWDYRKDVDAAAKRLLYIVVDDTQPALGYTAMYLDDHIILTLSREIEGSYITSEYFKLWRCNGAITEFYEQLSCSISKDGLRVVLNPEANLLSEQSYVAIVVGGAGGIVSTDAFILEENYVLSFKTTNTIRPITDVESQISSVDLWVDADTTDDIARGPRDYFSTAGEDVHISLLSSIPSNHSVGVGDIDSLTFIYDDTIANVVPRNALYGRWTDLPVDSDPLGAREIYIADVASEENRLTFGIETLTHSGMINKEYTFHLAKGVVRGNNKEAYDPDDHYVKFMGKLTPLYATPDQIQLRISSFLANTDTGILDYDLYKLIHEKSEWTDNKMGPPADTSELLERNQLVICLVLYDLVVYGDLLKGGVKSRSLLMTQVEYYGPKWDTIIKELEDCIRAGISSSYSGEIANIATGIKSGAHLNRQGKWYNVYR